MFWFFLRQSSIVDGDKRDDEKTEGTWAWRSVGWRWAGLLWSLDGLSPGFPGGSVASSVDTARCVFLTSTVVVGSRHLAHKAEQFSLCGVRGSRHWDMFTTKSDELKNKKSKPRWVRPMKVLSGCCSKLRQLSCQRGPERTPPLRRKRG